MGSFAIVGLVPVQKWRSRLNDLASKFTFILISGSLSAEIEFHNPEYRPKNCGFCVANHTSPIDISILSTDCTYSLVRRNEEENQCRVGSRESDMSFSIPIRRRRRRKSCLNRQKTQSGTTYFNCNSWELPFYPNNPFHSLKSFPFPFLYTHIY